MECDSCECEVGLDGGPSDGWQLEDGRTVCQRCCVADTRRILSSLADAVGRGIDRANKYFERNKINARAFPLSIKRGFRK